MAGAFTSFSVAIFLGSLISIAVLVMTVLIGIWVYRDAVSKGMNGVLWTLVVLLVPSFIGLIIYLIVRMDAKKVTCSKCMEKVNGNSKYCSKCGQELEPVIEVSEEDEKLRKSQKRILIGFFSTLGGVVIAIILMIAFILSGIVGAVGSGIKAFSDFSQGLIDWDYSVDADDVGDMLSSLDALFGEKGFNIDIEGDEVSITTGDGEEVIRVNENSDEVHINTSALYSLLDKYGISYNSLLSEHEVKEAVDEYLDKYLDGLEIDEDHVPEKLEEAAKELDAATNRLETALEKGDLSGLVDFGKEIARAQKLEFTLSGAAVPFKTLTGAKELEDFADDLNMDDWKMAKLPEDADEIGTISFTSEYKGTDGKMNEYKAFNLHVYKNIPYVTLEVAGVRIEMKTKNETMRYLNSFFQ